MPVQLPGIALGVGLGCLVGGAVGGISSWKIQARHQKRKAVDNKQPGTESSKGTASSEPQIKSSLPLTDAPSVELPVIPKLTAKFEVFNTKTFYFNSSDDSELYALLQRFEQYLQFPEEREGFRVAVNHIDNMLGMEVLLETREPVSALGIPTMGQSSRNTVDNLLRDIITFSNDQRPSATKKNDMFTLLKSIITILDDIVANMHKRVAAKTLI